MEGQDLLSLVKGNVYTPELRAKIAAMGLRRLGTMQWVNMKTGAKYELQFAGIEDYKVVTGVDAIEHDKHIHIVDPNDKSTREKKVKLEEIQIPAEFTDEVYRQFEISSHVFEMIDFWNYELSQHSPLGQELNNIVHREYVTWEDFVFLPDPLANGEYVFCILAKDPAASADAWLRLPDHGYVVPTNGSDAELMQSLRCGVAFHKFESESFETAPAAGQYAIKALNAARTNYAQAIRQLLGKVDAKITRNDFHRNEDNKMCRVEVTRSDYGINVTDQEAMPTLADSIDSLLAPFIRAKAFSEPRGDKPESYQQ